MNFEHIGTLPGSPQPQDIFEPYMPEVDLLSDMSGFFTQVRAILASDDLSTSVRNAGLDKLIQNAERDSAKGQCYVAVITPGRIISLAPAPLPNTKSEKELAPLKALLGSDRPLQITAISHTRLEAYMQDKTKTRCIPFLGILLGFAYMGHNVLVFEGHPSALEYGVKDSDLLIIDSGMLPFLPDNWADVVFAAMKPNARVFIHERASFRLTHVTRKNGPPGWQRTEPDGEPSYINMLLTTLGKSGYRQSVYIRSSEPAPAPQQFTADPDQLAYLSNLPFRYDRLRVDVIITTLWKLGKPVAGVTPETRLFKAKLAESGGKTRDVTYWMLLSTTGDGKQILEIKLQ